MNNIKTINAFYSAFQAQDGEKMASFYNDKATFSDPIFGNLNSNEVKNMWRMLCKNGKELSVKFSILSHHDDTVHAKWEARYLFSATNNMVTNHVESHIKLLDDKIIEHNDQFNFWKWSSQALGVPGKLLGWTPFMLNKVQVQARENLRNF